MATLLEKAKKVPHNRKIKHQLTKEKIELAVAWAKDEISIPQLSVVLGINKSGAQSYHFLATALKEYIKKTGSRKTNRLRN